MPDGSNAEKFSEIEKILVSLTEKLEDLEDLIMVENLGMIELKKNFDDIKTANPLAPSVIDEKIKKLEDEITSLKSTGVVATSTEGDKTVSIMNEINELKAEIDALKNSGGYDVKPVLDEINVLSQSTDSRFLEIERTLSEKTNSQIPENVLEDVKRIGEFEMRLENLEKIAMDFSKKLEEIRPAFEREGNFDKIDMINKEAEERLHESQESEENLRRLASEVRAEHDGLSERLDRVKNMEGEFNRVTAIVNMLRKEVDENRIEILQRVRMDDIDKKLKEIGRNISVQRPQDYSIVERIRLLEDRYMKLSNKLEEKRLKISHEDASEFVGLTKDMARIFEKIDQLDKKINSYDESSTKAMISDIKSKIAYFENRLNEIERMFKSNQKEKPMPMIIE